MVVALYLVRESIDKLDSLDAQAIVLLPWLEDEGKEWMSAWNAKVLGQNTWEATPLQLDPRVEQALKSLTNEILLYKGLTSHAPNKQLTQKTLSNLSKKGVSLDPSSIRKWALHHGWEPEDARVLEKMAAENS